VVTLLGDAEFSASQTKELEKEISNMANENKPEMGQHWREYWRQRRSLRAAGRSGKKPEDNRMVTSYDFKHPARVNKDQLRTLENLHDNFARLLSSTFSGAMRAVVDVDTAYVDQTTYREFIMSLSNPSCSYQFALGPTNGQAILDFAMPVVFASVDRVFGGKGSSAGVTARQLSQIEMGLFAKIVKRAVQDARRHGDRSFPWISPTSNWRPTRSSCR
jgi:flagellar motor switch protein FliM